MFEQVFKNELLNIDAKRSLADKLWAEIDSNYNMPGRYYHNLVHLDNLTEQLLPIKERIEDWQTLVFSIAYHDIIYDPLRQDNEGKSAALAYDRLTQLKRPADLNERCKQQILSTKRHQLSAEADTNYFTDADLSILGTDKNSYLDYAAQIRKEYSYYPDQLYKPGRKKILAAFLEMKNIFKTKYFRDKYEEQARNNISYELESCL